MIEIKNRHNAYLKKSRPQPCSQSTRKAAKREGEVPDASPQDNISTQSQQALHLIYHERMFIPDGRKVPNLCAKCISVNLRLAPSPEFCQTQQMVKWSAQCPGCWKCSPTGLLYPSLAERRCSSPRSAKDRYVSPTYIKRTESLHSEQMTAYTTSSDWHVKWRLMLNDPFGPLMVVADETCGQILHLGKPQGWCF